MNKKGTVFVGISGGVDSSVSAYLLQQQGYDVQGIFVKTWSPDWLPCTWVDEKRDAMRICAHLNIPFHFLDASDAYKAGVADYMIAEYRAGRTPNPDVLCNRVIKFGVMWEYARAHGADFIATGHYAQADGTYITKGVDAGKDQSYFLWMITKEELPHILFPIGHLHKSEVRKIAQQAKLFTAEKKDSQGICFLGDVDMTEFLSHYIEQKEGNVVDTKGHVIGTHKGVYFYTLGERHGFTITKKEGDTHVPYYVVDKNIKKNELVVSTEQKVSKKGDINKITIKLREQNVFALLKKHASYTAQIRYHGELIPAKYDGENFILEYQGSVALGQSLVVFDGEKLVAGGIIEKTV